MNDRFIKNHTINDIVKILGDAPQNNRGLHVHLSKKKFEEIPLTHPFRADSYAFILVIHGVLKIQLNLLSYAIQGGEMIAVKPHTVFHILEMSPDLELAGVSFTVDFILKSSFKNMKLNDLDFFTANSIPKLRLSNQEKEVSIILSKLLAQHNTAQASEISFREEIINHTFSLLLYHYGSLFKKKYPNLEADLSSQEALTLRFFQTLKENFIKERSVQFYADTLCLTSGYLSKVLKEVSGKSAQQLIGDTVIMEAKILLENPALTISQIAYALQFSDQSFFGKYFKRNTGFSPSQFRKITR